MWYRISDDYCITKTLDYVYDHHLLISTSIFFILKALWRYDNRLATRLSANVSNTISMSLSSPEKETLRRYQKNFIFIVFQQACIHSGHLFDIMMMMTSLTAKRAYIDLQRWRSSLLEEKDNVTSVSYSALLLPSVVQGLTYRPPSLIHSSLNLLSSLHTLI